MKRTLLIAVIVLPVLFLILGARRYIYSAYQHAGARFGINFNNIATGDYVKYIKSQTGEFEADQRAQFLNRLVGFKDRVSTQRADILGEATQPKGEKWIEVDLSDQKLYMKEGDTTAGSFLISSGKWAPTPQGQWRIWTKLRYTRMMGGSKALGTYYNLPNVPYTMYYDRGYGIHGAYWHNNFGNPMSHGCINMKPEEAGIVFRWADIGTKVIVHI
ncbi:hypothetical protein A3B51_00590 [Candidatus Curtissbacteria bacterium RIFCSPLOWO2_01_FULL_41_18]|uniref:L,D-TPase catalytic domain-containing protein n=1 Tax=Candidatus Curtissbacteria bacterium RIFCSPLOWO2_01_FULL_41_18 TaxID=1797727 RepID=A0A1F5HLX1_9BACT|nr:MAG: hypothetical protein A3B51_00590 [Candidatus Curtissbacteria bacterium RIFCSPLOWO2_01_FULL_41_18]